MLKIKKPINESICRSFLNSPDVKIGKNMDVLAMSLRKAREHFEREYLFAQVNRFGGNISQTASFIGMERSALHRKLKTLGVNQEERPVKLVENSK